MMIFRTIPEERTASAALRRMLQRLHRAVQQQEMDHYQELEDFPVPGMVHGLCRRCNASFVCAGAAGKRHACRLNDRL